MIATLTIEPRAVDPATHRGQLAPGQRWACEQPEKPGGTSTAWGQGCLACLTHSVACMVNEPSMATVAIPYRPTEQFRSVLIRFNDLCAMLADAAGNEILLRQCAELGGDPALGRERCGIRLT